jgi:hypothetical protein
MHITHSFHMVVLEPDRFARPYVLMLVALSLHVRFTSRQKKTFHTWTTAKTTSPRRSRSPKPQPLTAPTVAQLQLRQQGPIPTFRVAWESRQARSHMTMPNSRMCAMVLACMCVRGHVSVGPHHTRTFPDPIITRVNFVLYFFYHDSVFSSSASRLSVSLTLTHSAKAEKDKSPFDFAQEGNIEALKRCFNYQPPMGNTAQKRLLFESKGKVAQPNPAVDAQDETGKTYVRRAIHHAASIDFPHQLSILLSCPPIKLCTHAILCPLCSMFDLDHT